MSHRREGITKSPDGFGLKFMPYTAHKSVIYALFLIVFLCFDSAVGIVLHPAGEPNLTIWTDRPADDVVGRWGNIASCIAVSSDCVITTRHQTSSVSVTIGGKTYTIAQVWNHSTADLRIAKLNGANLADFVDIYDNTDETGKLITMGGYGKRRGAILQTSGITYGYEWDSAGNTLLRFGTNKINYTYDDYTCSGMTSDLLVADFDGLGVGQSTVYEGACADHDSGCGWFIKYGGIWEVAGLGRAVEAHYEQGHEGDPDYIIYNQSWFRNAYDPSTLDPDYIDAVRLSSYAAWIYMTIPPRLPGELTGDGLVDFADFAVFVSYWLDMSCHYPDWCRGCDFEPDGDVDFADFAEFASHWLAGE